MSNPDDYGEVAQRLSTAFTDFRLEVFEERHHFDPPHRVDPDRLAAALVDTWRRAPVAAVAGRRPIPATPDHL